MTVRRFLIMAFAILVALATGTALMLKTAPGHHLIAARALKILGDAVGAEVHATRVAGDWPNHIALEGITISDPQGPWLTVDHLTLDWHAATLLRGRIAIDALHADTVHMLRRPAASGNSSTFNPGKIRPALEQVRVDALTIATLRLDAPVLGRAGTVAVTGAITDAVNSGTEGPIVTLGLERKDAAGTASFTLALPPGALTLNAQAAIAGVTLDSAVALDQRTNQLSGKVKLACGGESPCLTWTGGTLGAVAVDADMGGTLSAPQATAALNVSGLGDGGRSLAALTGTATIAPAPRGLTLRGEGTARGLKAAVPELASIIGDDGSWSLNGETAGQTFTVTSFAIDAGDITATISGAAAAGALSNITGAFSVRRIGRLLGMPDAASSTRIDLALDRLTFMPFAAAGRITADMNNMPPGMSLAPVAAGRMHFTSPAIYENGRLVFSAVTGSFGKTTFRGATTWSRGARGLDHHTTTLAADVSPEAFAGASAPLRVEGRLAGGRDALKADFTATASSIALAGAPVTDVKAAIAAARDHGLWRGNATLESVWRGQPLTVATDFTQDTQTALALSNSRATALAAALAGSLKINTGAGTVTGALAGRAPDLAPLAAALGVPTTGGGDLAITFTDNKAQRIALSLATARVHGDTFTADSLSAQAVIDDAWGKPKLALRVKATDGVVLGRPLAQLTVAADGAFSALAVQVRATGAGSRKFALDTAGTLTLGNGVAADLSRLALQDGRIAAKLLAPTHFAYSATAVSLAPTRIAVSGGEATAQFTLDRRADRISGEVAAAKVVLGDSPELPGAARTVIDGTLKLSGTASAADADFALAAHYIAKDAGADIQSKITAALHQGRATINGSANGLSDEDAVLKAELPARLDLTAPRLAFDMNAPITGALTWHGEIKPLWQILALDQHLMEGHADVDINATGTLEQPAVKGGVKLSKGRYENLASGTALQGLEAEFTAMNGYAMAIKLSATDTGNGRIAAQGTMTLDREQGRWSVDASGDLTAFHILRRDDVTAAATGHVTYKGPALAGTLAGRLQVVRSEMRIGASYVPEVPLLRARAVGPPPAPGQPSTVQLDITLAIDDVLRIEGKGLEAFWRGSLRARGGLDHPDLSGTLTLARGSFTFLGRSFDLDTGSITFTGGGKVDPELALSASRQSGDVTATVAISGRASQPQITLSSVPVLPQDEVLAQLLFSKGATQLGPLESLQLASAAADLAGLSQGGLSGMLRRTFGLDIVGFGGKSGDAVVLGHQFTSALYVGVEQSVGTTNQHLIVVEWRLSRSLAVQSTTTPQTGADLGLIWRKNY